MVQKTGETMQAPPIRPILDTHGSDFEVAKMLLRESLRTAAPQATIAALSIMAPTACLELLCDPVHAIAAAFSNADLSTLIQTAIRSFDGDPAKLRRIASVLAKRYSETLTGEAAQDVIGALGAELDPAEDAAFESIARRFPHHPGLLRAAIKIADTQGDDARLDELLTRLGAADGTPGTVAFIHRFRQRRQAPRPADVRIAVVSSFTVNQLVPYVDLACRKLNLSPDFYISPFNSWTRDFVDEGSGLRRFLPDIVFLAVSIDDLAPQLTRSLTLEELEAAGATALERVVNVAASFRTWSQAPLVVHSFHSAFVGPLGVLDDGADVSRAAWLARLNARLAESLRALPLCYLLDVGGTTSRAGGLRDNAKLRHLASMRLPPEALPGLADAYVRYIVPVKGLTKKCVVLDLDNTLWGGIIGEGSKDEILLGHTSPGSEFVEFQEFLRSLSARGILLALNSKNNPDDALEAIRTHEAMVLRETDFSAIRINWKPKPENMISIAEELNIGVESLVFVDDNPDEREQMRQLLPQVLTVDLPKDPALYRSVLEGLPELQTLAVTAEDRSRVEQYRTTRLREQAKLTVGGVGEYLRSLEIHVAIELASKQNAVRVAQLFARTNQFNVTTRRYDMADVGRFLEDSQRRLFVLSSRDRFGAHGLVALALVRIGSISWEIDSFIMSCRVIGYGIEGALLAHLSQQAHAAGVRDLIGEFIETKKNAPANDLYARHGFREVDARGEVHRWQLSLRTPIPFPAWIKVDAP
jgi:FkbH-like protein